MPSFRMLYSLLLLCSLSVAQSLESSAPCEPLPYRVYWNVGESNPPAVDLNDFLIFPANFTQTGSGCSNPGCTPWSQGLFPTISDSGEIVNGGVPQNANLTAHLEALAKAVVTWIPDPDWSGNAVLDFEAWTTVWELNDGKGKWHGLRYMNYSIYLEKLKHPDWNESEIVAAAKKDFQAAATTFFVETLKTLTGLRPKAKWGFYGLPMNFYEPCEGTGKDMKCGYDSPLGDYYRALSDEQIPIWEASTALYPSIYFPPFHSTDENAAYVRSMVNEAQRCANGKIPVFPFHWNYYHNATTLLTPQDLHSGLILPYDLGAQGVVMWGSSTELQNETFIQYVEKEVGPMTKSFVTSMCQCGAKYCSGHGRCMPSSSTTCQCYQGYSGPHCETEN